MRNPMENFPQTQLNSIGEKLVIDNFEVGIYGWLMVIRRLPLDSPDSVDEMWDKNAGICQELPLICLW